MATSTFFIKDTSNSAESIQQIERSVSKLKGVERALMDTDDGELKIEYNEKEIELLDIATHIESRGFQIS